jgi:hypothetical protein
MIGRYSIQIISTTPDIWVKEKGQAPLYGAGRLFARLSIFFVPICLAIVILNAGFIISKFLQSGLVQGWQSIPIGYWANLAICLQALILALSPFSPFMTVAISRELKASQNQLMLKKYFFGLPIQHTFLPTSSILYIQQGNAGYWLEVVCRRRESSQRHYLLGTFELDGEWLGRQLASLYQVEFRKDPEYLRLQAEWQRISDGLDDTTHS